MHARIRRYEGVGGTSDHLAQVARELGSTLSRACGFVSCVVLEAEAGVVATVSIFEDWDSLEEADRMVEKSLAEHLPALLAEPSQVITGEIVFQRGL